MPYPPFVTGPPPFYLEREKHKAALAEGVHNDTPASSTTTSLRHTSGMASDRHSSLANSSIADRSTSGFACTTPTCTNSSLTGTPAAAALFEASPPRGRNATGSTSSHNKSGSPSFSASAGAAASSSRSWASASRAMTASTRRSAAEGHRRPHHESRHRSLEAACGGCQRPILLPPDYAARPHEQPYCPFCRTHRFTETFPAGEGRRSRGWAWCGGDSVAAAEETSGDADVDELLASSAVFSEPPVSRNPVAARMLWLAPYL